MKYLTLVFLTFAFFSMSKTAEARNHVVMCDSCTTSQMKNKATSIRPTRYYEYVYVFDEAQGAVKKYRISQRYIDDFIEFTVATEMTVESDLYNKWQDYLYNSRMAKKYLLDSLSTTSKYSMQFSFGNYDASKCYSSPTTFEAGGTQILDSIDAFDFSSSSQAMVNVSRAMVADNPYIVAAHQAGSYMRSILDNSMLPFRPFGDNALRVRFKDGSSALAKYNFNKVRFEPVEAMDKDCNVIPKTLNEARELNQMNFSSAETYEAMNDYFNERFNSQWFSEGLSQGKFNTCSIKVTCRDESNNRFVCIGKWQCY